MNASSLFNSPPWALLFSAEASRERAFRRVVFNRIVSSGAQRPGCPAQGQRVSGDEAI